MKFTEIEEWDRYQKFLWETDPTELIKTGVERYQEEVLGVRNLVTCGDVVSIMQSMVMKEDLRLKNKGGYMQIIVDQLKIKESQVLGYLDEKHVRYACYEGIEPAPEVTDTSRPSSSACRYTFFRPWRAASSTRPMM